MALIHKATLIPPKLKLLTAWLPSRSCWVYDGCGDPVWATALATTMLTGGTQAGEFVDMGGRLEARELRRLSWEAGRPARRFGRSTR